MVKKQNILITGANGQLGKCIREIADNFLFYNIIFKNKKELDITNFSGVSSFFENQNINTVINCAAFTNVIEAENNKQYSDLVNSASVANLAEICKINDVKLIHISTDYVFDGTNDMPYTENELVNPVNYYGLSKLNGEKYIIDCKIKNSLIIRTSWLYSKYGNNFVNKILKLISNKYNVCITENNIGSPTNAMDLANALLNIISKISNDKAEIYHYSNSGKCSTYDFADYIIQFYNNNSSIELKLNPDLLIKRPKFSALNTEKICNKFDLKIEPWQSSLKKHLCNEV